MEKPVTFVCSGGYMTGSSVVTWKILIVNARYTVRIYVYTYDTDHDYKKQMVRENVRCIFISCQFIKPLWQVRRL